MLDSAHQYLKDISIYPLLSKNEEIELLTRAQQGDKDAYNEVYCANLRLVAKLAGKYKTYKRDYLDFVQDGNIALGKAINNYDIQSDTKFASYASRIILNAMKEGLHNEGDVIRLPEYIHRTITKVRQFIASYYSENACYPSQDELLEYSNGKLTKEDILTEYKYTKPIDSLDRVVYDDSSDGESLYNFVKDPNLDINFDDYQDLNNHINQLNTIDKKIVLFYFGLDNHLECTTKEIAKSLNMSESNVRDRLSKSLATLRNLAELDSSLA